jgi:hypothetical protein
LALEAKRQNDIPLFVQAGNEMVAIDPSNPEGFELLAEALMLQEKWEEALHTLELARDTLLMTRAISSSPRCFDIVRKTILGYAEEYGIEVVDTLSICKQYTGIEIPGRELFLDYCHHTVIGIKTIMQHSTVALLRLLLKKEISAGQVKPSNIFPSKDAAAIAHFCAAIHNAHNGQSPDVIEYHCQKAIALSPDVKEPMLTYIDFATRYASTSLCRTYERMCMDGHMRQWEGGIGLMHPPGGKLMDVTLVDAIGRALKSTGNDIENHILQLRKKEHGIQTNGVSLLESFYCSTSYNEFEVTPKPGYYQARTTETEFYFVADEGQSLTFFLEYRTTGNARDNATVNVYFNDDIHPVQQLKLADLWTNGSFAVSKEWVKEGINKLVIVWPYTFKPLPQEGLHIDGGLLKALYPVLGEIHSFRMFAGTSDT